MEKTKDIVFNHIKSTYDLNKPIFVKDVYNTFSGISKNTIRSLFKRYKDLGKLVIIDKGVYAFPNKDSILGKPTVYVEGITEEKYIRTILGKRIGYRSGINFANSLGLTSQTASVPTIYTNVVSRKKRIVEIKNSRIIINAPRIEVSENNYKLLQVMDLLNNFERYSEYPLKEVSNILLKYLSETFMTEDEMDRTVSAYPLEAQVKFYRIGGLYVLTQIPRNI